jgi:hypothetical protein
MQRKTSARILCLLAVSALLLSGDPVAARDSGSLQILAVQPIENTVSNQSLSVLSAVTKGVKIAPDQKFQIAGNSILAVNSGSQLSNVGTLTGSGNNQLTGLTGDYTASTGIVGPVLGTNVSQVHIANFTWETSQNQLQVGSLNLATNAGFNAFPGGMEVYPSSIPSETNPIVSAVITAADINKQVVQSGLATKSASGFQAIGIRPDFKYQPEKLKFERLATSELKGQPGMNVGPATAQGTSRYVPLGEF